MFNANLTGLDPTRFQTIWSFRLLLRWWIIILSIFKVNTLSVSASPSHCRPSPINTRNIRAIGIVDQALFLVYDRRDAWNLKQNDQSGHTTTTDIGVDSLRHLHIVHYNRLQPTRSNLNNDTDSALVLKLSHNNNNNKQPESESKGILDFDLKHPIEEQRFVDKYPALVPALSRKQIVDILFLDQSQLLVQAHSLEDDEHWLILYKNGTIVLEQEVNSVLNSYRILYDQQQQQQQYKRHDSVGGVNHPISIQFNSKLLEKEEEEVKDTFQKYRIDLLSTNQLTYHGGHLLLPLKVGFQSSRIDGGGGESIEIHTDHHFRYLAFSHSLDQIYLVSNQSSLTKLGDYLPASTLLPPNSLVRWSLLSHSGQVYLIVTNELVLCFRRPTLIGQQEPMTIETKQLTFRLDLWTGCETANDDKQTLKNGDTSGTSKFLIFLISVSLVAIVILACLSQHQKITEKSKSVFRRFGLTKEPPTNKSCSIRSCPSTCGSAKIASLRYDQRWKSVGSQVDHISRIRRIQGQRERRERRKRRHHPSSITEKTTGTASHSASSSSSDSVNSRGTAAVFGLPQQVIEDRNSQQQMALTKSIAIDPKTNTNLAAAADDITSKNNSDNKTVHNNLPKKINTN